MRKICRTQTEHEQLLIREFVGLLGYTISNFWWQKEQKPDAVLTLSKGKKRKRVAVEHTDYFNDTLAGQPSPRSTIADFWKLVQDSLVRRISHRKHLMDISGQAGDPASQEGAACGTPREQAA